MKLVTGFLIALLTAAQAVSSTPVPIDSLERGMTTTITGEVTRILDEDEFRLQDESGSVRVYTGWQNRVMINSGEKLSVRGFVDNDIASYFRPEFYAFEIIRENGEVVKLHGD